MNNLPPVVGLIGVGWYFAACVVLGILGGRWLDGQAGAEPVFTLLGVLLGLAAAGYGGYRMLLNVLGPRRRR